jgi:MutS domain V
MKAYLMYEERDFDQESALPSWSGDMAQDLGLSTVWAAMANGDKQVYGVCQRAFLLPLQDSHAVQYRQDILADCVAHADQVRELYKTAVDAVDAERHVWGLSDGSPQLVLWRAVGSLGAMVPYLKKLHRLAALAANDFRSSGFTRFFDMLVSELDEGYVSEVERHLSALKFNSGFLISWRLGEGLSAVDHSLRWPRRKAWRERLALQSRHSFDIPPRDDAGGQVLDAWRSRALNRVANAAAQSADHVRDFFRVVAAELSFYVGCLNLIDILTAKGAPFCRPQAVEGSGPVLATSGLYDIGLALRIEDIVVGNEVTSDGADYIVVTGANQGGKSTFLRSLGIAQLMMQCGMPCPAQTYRASLASAVFTHFKREEDVAMESGKFDEELKRMSQVVTSIKPRALLLCNESFASTNEQEGSDIALDIVRALVAADIRVAYVTHMFELARRLSQELPHGMFFRAERLADGRRTFKIVPGQPEPTSYGEDSFRRVFAATG